MYQSDAFPARVDQGLKSLLIAVALANLPASGSQAMMIALPPRGSVYYLEALQTAIRRQPSLQGRRNHQWENIFCLSHRHQLCQRTEGHVRVISLPLGQCPMPRSLQAAYTQPFFFQDYRNITIVPRQLTVERKPCGDDYSSLGT